MEKFNFIDYTEKVDIAGHIFDLECTAETGEAINSFKTKLVAIPSEVSSGTKTTEEAISLCSGVTDQLLGEGAFEKIFTGRKIRFDDAMDVCLFLIQAVAAGYNKRNATLKKKGLLIKK